MSRKSITSNRKGRSHSQQAPVMLALSSFRHSPEAVYLALSKAARSREIISLVVVDANLEEYIAGSDAGYYPSMANEGRRELLRDHRKDARRKSKAIQDIAEGKGIKVRSYIKTGRFENECLRLIRETKPQVVITTHSKQLPLVRWFCGSAVDRLRKKADCQVVAA